MQLITALHANCLTSSLIIPALHLQNAIIKLAIILLICRMPLLLLMLLVAYVLFLASPALITQSLALPAKMDIYTRRTFTNASLLALPLIIPQLLLVFYAVPIATNVVFLLIIALRALLECT